MKQRSQQRVFSASRAFTLIELLIVVAIIAILAAIAVPNFLEAQTRSKVSRVQADFRTIATAIESYFVDKNSYPWDQDDTITSTNEDGFRLLTTPISYFSSGRALSDPFADPRLTANDRSAPHYQMASGVNPRRRLDRTNPDADPRCFAQQAWLLFSWGPDNSRGEFPDASGNVANGMANDDWPCFRTDTSTPSDMKTPYDPTNGTISVGNIYRLGGDYGTGSWTIEGVDHNVYGARATYP
jgi:prepilin-type N-terminal cleavage/methylation domain-containing protein